jgi:putative transposase
MTDALYYTDLSDGEYAVLAPLLPQPRPTGRPRRHPLRIILNGISYVLRSGCQWRRLPREFPPWQSVYHSFRAWRLDGTWERLHTALREQLRGAVGRNPQPSAGAIDSQSVKTTGVGGVRGDDGAKKLSGRKRHVLVETQGLVARVRVHAADIQDRAAVPLLLAGVREEFPRLQHVWVDLGYTGTGKRWIEEELGWSVEVVQHPPRPRGEWVPLGTGDDPRPFAWRRLPPERTRFRGVLPRRWVVERTFRWFGQNRRLSTDDERLCTTSECLIYATMIRIMARRLARR